MPRAACRPRGDHREVRRQTPRVHPLEHVVLEHEVACVVPVVRDLVPVVVAHHIGLRGRQRAAGIVGLVTREETALARLRLEAVHLPAVDVMDRVDHVVWAAGIAVIPVVVRLNADMRLRVGVAGDRTRIARKTGDTVGAGIRPEVGVERAVLLHDHHDVLDLVDPPARPRPRLVPMPRNLGRGKQQHGERGRREKDQDDPPQDRPSLRRTPESEVRRRY